MSNGKGGRPPGVNCEYNDRKGRCKKAARVVVVLDSVGRDGTVKAFRCWRHYVELENAARSSCALTITYVEIL